jgi:hypothetical protein
MYWYDTVFYTTDLWRTDIHVLVYIIENGVQHVARAIQNGRFFLSGFG